MTDADAAFDAPDNPPEPMVPTTTLEFRLLNCLREARRVNCRGFMNEENDAWHRSADTLLALQPDVDDVTQRFNDPARQEHRQFVSSLFRRR